MCSYSSSNLLSFRHISVSLNWAKASWGTNLRARRYRLRAVSPPIYAAREFVAEEDIHERAIVMARRLQAIVRSVEALIGAQFFESDESFFFMRGQMAQMTLQSSLLQRRREWRRAGRGHGECFLGETALSQSRLSRETERVGD